MADMRPKADILESWIPTSMSFPRFVSDMNDTDAKISTETAATLLRAASLLIENANEKIELPAKPSTAEIHSLNVMVDDLAVQLGAIAKAARAAENHFRE